MITLDKVNRVVALKGLGEALDIASSVLDVKESEGLTQVERLKLTEIKRTVDEFFSLTKERFIAEHNAIELETMEVIEPVSGAV